MPIKSSPNLRGCLMLLIFFTISVGISSCAFNPRILKFRKNDKDKNAGTAAVFQTDGVSAVYNTKVDFYKFHFSGLVAIKKHTDSNYDVALISEMGMTLIKMKYIEGKYEDVTVLEELNRPMVINLIQNDLAMLMIDESTFKKKWLSQRSNDVEVLKLKQKGQTPFFIYFGDDNISRIDKADALGKKISINFLSYEEGIPNEIHLKHFGLKNATLNFKKLEKQEKSEYEYDIEE